MLLPHRQLQVLDALLFVLCSLRVRSDATRQSLVMQALVKMLTEQQATSGSNL
jgi:hypothetical protein